QNLYKAGLRINILIGGIMSLFFICFSRQLVEIFVSTPETIEMGSAYLRIVGFSQIFMGLDMMTAGTYNGQGLTKYPAMNSIFQTIFRIPFAYYMSHYTSLGLDGVWISISLTSVSRGIVLFFMYKVRQRKLSRLSIVQFHKEMKKHKMENQEKEYPYSSNTINDN
ncbi:MAG: MATE family efflux transporter, partial [Bacteroidales bacterium]